MFRRQNNLLVRIAFGRARRAYGANPNFLPLEESRPGPSEDTMFKAKTKPQLLKPHIDPSVCDAPNLSQFEKELTVQRLFDARVHLGHKIGTLEENIKWAIYGTRLDVCIFDLDITRKYLLNALNFVEAVAYSGGRFMFVSSNKSSMLMVEDMARQLNQYAHTRKWRQGTLINARAFFKKMTVRLPDCIIFLGTLTGSFEKHPGIIEAAKLCIPTVGIVDSNSEPNYISYPVPGNDDSIASLNFYLQIFAKAIRMGQERNLRMMEKLKNSESNNNNERNTMPNNGGRDGDRRSADLIR